MKLRYVKACERCGKKFKENVLLPIPLHFVLLCNECHDHLVLGALDRMELEKQKKKE